MSSEKHTACGQQKGKSTSTTYQGHLLERCKLASTASKIPIGHFTAWHQHDSRACLPASMQPCCITLNDNNVGLKTKTKNKEPTIQFVSSPHTSLSLKNILHYLHTLGLSFSLLSSLSPHKELSEPIQDSSGYLPFAVPMTAGF